MAEIWHEKPEWRPGDTFDALMNYPLTEALLAFTAARNLDTDLVRRHNEYSNTVRPIGGTEFARRLDRVMTSGTDRRRFEPAQPAGQPRHSALPDRRAR